MYVCQQFSSQCWLVRLLRMDRPRPSPEKRGAAGSWQMANRAATMSAGEFEFGFAVDWMRKDMGICLAEAKSNGARLPVAALVDQFYAQVQARGGRRWDTSSLMHLLAND